MERIIRVLTDNDFNKQIITRMCRNIEKRNHSNSRDTEDTEYAGYIHLPCTSEILRPNYQKTLDEYAFLLEEIKYELKHLKTRYTI